MKKIFVYAFMGCLVGLSSCENNSREVDYSKSIYDGVSNLAVQNDFDKWIYENYTKPYNIRLMYRFEDKESDMDYNVVPADYKKSVALAKLVKFLWLDVYDEVAGHDFIAKYCPKIMHFIGSPEYEASSSSIVLGTAEGGMKITMFNINAIDINNPDINFLNYWFFKTMHHEFAHILHQTKFYTTDFISISDGKYNGPGWVNVNDADARKAGFITAYGSSAVDEDFVETLANYVIYGDEAWNEMLAEGGDEGKAIILQKLAIVRDYMKESWNIDLDLLRQRVQEKQAQVKDLDLTGLN